MVNRRGKSGSVTVFLFLDSKMTPDSDKGHENERLLLMGKKAMIKLDRVLKSRDVVVSSFADKIPYSQSYGGEGLTIKKGEH